jgi:hypothetical protein
MGGDIADKSNHAASDSRTIASEELCDTAHEIDGDRADRPDCL